MYLRVVGYSVILRRCINSWVWSFDKVQSVIMKNRVKRGKQRPWPTLKHYSGTVKSYELAVPTNAVWAHNVQIRLLVSEVGCRILTVIKIIISKQDSHCGVTESDQHFLWIYKTVSEDYSFFCGTWSRLYLLCEDKPFRFVPWLVSNSFIFRVNASWSIILRCNCCKAWMGN
jgi:hypothetical protein